MTNLQITVNKGEYQVGEVVKIKVTDGTQDVKCMEYDPYFTGATGIPSKLYCKNVPDGTPIRSITDTVTKAKVRDDEFKVIRVDPETDFSDRVLLEKM